MVRCSAVVAMAAAATGATAVNAGRAANALAVAIAGELEEISRQGAKLAKKTSHFSRCDLSWSFLARYRINADVDKLPMAAKDRLVRVSIAYRVTARIGRAQPVTTRTRIFVLVVTIR